MKAVSRTNLPESSHHHDNNLEASKAYRTKEMTADVSSPSAQTWLETLDSEEADTGTLLDYFLGGEQPESNLNAADADNGKMARAFDESGVGLSEKMLAGFHPAAAYESVPHQKSTPPSILHSQFSSSQQSLSAAPSNNALPTPSTPAVQFYANVSNRTSRQGSPTESADQNDASREIIQQEVPVLQPTHAQSELPTQPQRSDNNHSHNSHEQNMMVYSTSVQNQEPSTSSTSPSLALHGMGSTPILHVHQQFQSQRTSVQKPFNTTYNVTSMSPISPAVMCTNEVLMLPTANRYGTSHPAPAAQGQGQTQAINGTGTTAQDQWSNNISGTNINVNSATTTSQQMQLPAWLQHMNNVASMAIQAGAGSSAMAAPPQASQRPSNHTFSAPNPTTSFNPTRTQQQAVYTHTHGIQIFPGADILPLPGAIAAMQHRFNLKDDQASESKEKREKRLARNRESARQSRRRKKELLLNLRSQVNKLHDNIEDERRKAMQVMETDIVADRMMILSEIFTDYKYNGRSAAGMDRLIRTIRESGPNIKERKAVIEFQYNALRKLILPCYRQIFLSLSLKDRRFLTEAKEIRIKTQKTTGRVSSKQVGEELTKKNADNFKEGNAAKNSLSCSANDRSLFWPLLCYELSVGIDQEEKFLQAFENLRMDPGMHLNRSKISAAAKLISNLKASSISQSRSVANQNELALLQILTPAQSIRFLEWFLQNKNRCDRLLGKKNRSNDASVNECGLMTKATSDHSLSDFCQQLTDNMSIKKIDGNS